MPRIIQFSIDSKDRIVVLTDSGDMYQRMTVVEDHVAKYRWSVVDLPACCLPVPDSPSAEESSAMAEFIVQQSPSRSQLRRPTSIGSDGNYLPPLGD